MAYSEKTREIFSERLRYIMMIRNIRAKDIVEKLHIEKNKARNISRLIMFVVIETKLVNVIIIELIDI